MIAFNNIVIAVTTFLLLYDSFNTVLYRFMIKEDNNHHQIPRFHYVKSHQ